MTATTSSTPGARGRSAPSHLAHCRCGAVEIAAWADPIGVNACYCNDCQAAALRFRAMGSGEPVTTADGGTEFMLFRRDRVSCTQGADRLEVMRLSPRTKTRRTYASCCTTPMYISFDDKRPWVSAHRASFGASAPRVQMRICTRFRKSELIPGDGVPNHNGYPPAMILRLLAAWPAVLFGRPVGRLP